MQLVRRPIWMGRQHDPATTLPTIDQASAMKRHEASSVRNGTGAHPSLDAYSHQQALSKRNRKKSGNPKPVSARMGSAVCGNRATGSGFSSTCLPSNGLP